LLPWICGDMGNLPQAMIWICPLKYVLDDFKFISHDLL
jgi:hypothetical protein